MSAKTHHLLTSGQVRGLYGSALDWWMKNPDGIRQDHHYLLLHIQGIHNKFHVYRNLPGDRLTPVFLGDQGYLETIWQSGLEYVMRLKAVILNLKCDFNNLDCTDRTTGWRSYQDHKSAIREMSSSVYTNEQDFDYQLAWTAHVREVEPDLKLFFVRYWQINNDGIANRTTALVLLKPWQWASLHASLYALSAPLVARVP